VIAAFSAAITGDIVRIVVGERCLQRITRARLSAER